MYFKTESENITLLCMHALNLSDVCGFATPNSPYMKLIMTFKA